MNSYLLNRLAVVQLVEQIAAGDGRVSMSELSLSVWCDALEGRAAVDAQAAVRQWYAEERQGPPTAASIKKMTISAQTSREAKARALTAGSRSSDGKMTRAEWKAKYPGRWEELRAQGAAEQAAKFAPVDEYLSDFGGLRVVR